MNIANLILKMELDLKNVNEELSPDREPSSYRTALLASKSYLEQYLPELKMAYKLDTEG